MAGQQTLNLYVEVRLLCPQPERLTGMVNLFFLCLHGLLPVQEL